MKNFYLLFFVFFISGVSFSQTILYQEDFETFTNGTNYNTSVAEFTDGSGDFFIRTDGSNIALSYQLTGFSGSFYFAAMDLDGEGATLPLTISTKPMNVSGLTNVDFAILLAEDDDGTNQDWDNSDYVHITYSLDGGSEQNLIWIEGDESSGTTNNSMPRIDTNFDGTGDSTEISSVFTEFTESIALSGNSTIQFFIEYNLNAEDEDLSVDNIRVIAPAVLNTKENEIEGFSIYPNPSSLGYINISSKSLEKIEVRVFDILGKQVINTSITDNKLDVSNLKSGVYIIKALQDNFRSTQKLIIK